MAVSGWETHAIIHQLRASEIAISCWSLTVTSQHLEFETPTDLLHTVLLFTNHKASSFLTIFPAPFTDLRSSNLCDIPYKFLFIHYAHLLKLILALHHLSTFFNLIWRLAKFKLFPQIFSSEKKSVSNSRVITLSVADSNTPPCRLALTIGGNRAGVQGRLMARTTFT